MVSFTHGQNIICNQTELDDIAHEQTIICSQLLLFASLSPALSMATVQKRYARLHSILLPWSLTMSFIPSAANPLIYFVRNKKMRNAFKSIINM